jgi:hypothetical protein
MKMKCSAISTKHKYFFQQEIIHYLTINKSAKSTPFKTNEILHRVDINEFFKKKKTGGLMTVGVSTCKSIAISYPARFSYLTHITPPDEIYVDSSLTQFFS